ncbi:MAG TPA: hypothetical protein VFI00_17965 [Kribbella sp.]|nr:hypothetical protein [Kribbella sp.]
MSANRRLRGHQWTAVQRAVLIAVLTIVMGSLLITSYSIALADPVPHHIDAALVGTQAGQARTVDEIQSVADDSLEFHPYPSVSAAMTAIDQQRVYAALDLTSPQPTLYVASAAGASVARVLERIDTADPGVRVVDTHPLDPDDPSGLDVFYLMFVSTIVGFFTVFQVRPNAGGLSLRRWTGFVVALSVAASFAFTFVTGPLLHRLALPMLESWGILSLQLLAAASFASLASVLIGRWAVLPTWLFFVILGNSASGGAVAPPLLPRPLAFVSQWLPSGATVTALREAIYFPADQHVQPIVVLATWAVALFVAMVVVSRRLGRSPGKP